MTYNDLADAIVKASEKQAVVGGKRARLGFNQDAYSIPVDGKAGWVWVRIEDGSERSPAQAWNKNNIRLIPDLPVRVAYDGKQLTVIDYDAEVPSFVGEALGLLQTNEPQSGAMEPISARRLSAGLIGVHPDGGKQAYVYPFAYNYDGVDYYYSGGTLDLTSYWPASGSKRWIKLGFDPLTAAPVAAAGDDFPTIASIPKTQLAAISFAGYWTFAGVEVTGDQTGVISEQQFIDFTPWRSGAGYEDFWHNGASAMRLWGGAITENLDGTVDVEEGQGIVKQDSATVYEIPSSTFDGQGSRVSVVSWDAVSSLALTDDAENIIYYNGDTDAIEATTSYDNVSATRAFSVGRAYRDGTSVTQRACGMNFWNYRRRHMRFGEKVFPVVKGIGGLIVSEVGERYLHVTEGELFAEVVNPFELTSKDTSVSDTFKYWYRDGVGDWTKVTGQVQIDNLQYDDGSGTLAALTANRYGVHWVYAVHNDNNMLHVVYGQEDYTLGNAELASPPSTLPGLLAAYSTIIARIIVQKSATNLYSIEAPDPTRFSSSGAADHGGLSGLADDDHDAYSLVSHSFVTINSEARLTSERVLTAGTGITITDGGAGSTVTIAADAEPRPGICQGRLTLDSNDPVPTTDQTAKTSVYFLPYAGDKISLYDGSNWKLFDIGSSGVNVAVPSTTVTPFDVFAYDNSGSLAIETLDWADDTRRATEIVEQDGVYVKSGATGRRYLGTGRTTSVSGQCEDSEANRFLWNYYNRVQKRLEYNEATSHTNGSSTWVEWRSGAGGPHRAYLVLGVAEEPFLYTTFGAMFDGGRTSIGVNTVAAPSGNQNSNSNTAVIRATASGLYQFPIGYSYVALVERGATGPATLQSAALEVVING
jgi:hypothetical protein